MNRYFAIGLGADSGRCVAGTLEKGKLIMEEIHRFPTRYFRFEGADRWDLVRIYEEILEGLRKYSAKFGPELSSLACDGWACDYGLFDASGRLLDLPHSYRDSRVSGSLLLTDPYREWLYAKTGIQFLEFNTLNQLLIEYADPQSRVRNASCFLFIGDTIHAMLGAPPRCEWTTASISVMADTKRKKWDDEILTEFKIPRSICPQLCFAGETIGKLRKDLTELSNVHGTGGGDVRIVAPAVHDTASAALAIPAEGADFAYISSGTWSIFGTELDAPVLTPEACALNISNSAGALGKSLFLKNVMGLWVLQSCKRAWNKTQPDLSYNDIEQAARKAAPFAAFIDVDAADFFNPPDMPRAIMDYLDKTGQKKPAAGDYGAMARLVYEGLALKYRDVLDRIKKTAGKNVKVVHVVGGGSKDALLNEFVASSCGLPVVAGPAEGTAMGNLLLQAYAAGELHSIEEIRAVVAASTETTRFEPQHEDAWLEAYKTFKQRFV
jgi:rhamnulokinase